MGQGSMTARADLLKVGIVALALAVLLSGCTEKEEILAGPRLDLRAQLDQAQPTPEPTAQPVALSLPAQATNRDWTHRGGNAQHRPGHPALGGTLAPLWVVSIGAGDGRQHRITAEPVVTADRIFTLDSRALVSAVSTGGALLWSRDLTPENESADDASGGGLAIGGNRLFVTSGFGRLTALDTATGSVIWSQRFDAPVSAAPTVEGDLLYVVAEDSSAWAIEADSGKVHWQLPGTPSIAGVVGGPGPAISGQIVILPFPSGEVQGVLKDSGLKLWQATVGGKRLGRASAFVPDITGDPVIVGDTAYIGNQGGRLAAVDVRSGSRLWTAGEGAYGTVMPVGGSLFLVSDAAQLVRLDADTGALIWAVDLPEFTTDKVKKLKDVYANYGPLLAGGRLIVASGDGVIRQFDPASGALTGSLGLDGAAATDPVVAGGVLYLVTTDGKLHAFR